MKVIDKSQIYEYDLVIAQFNGSMEIEIDMVENDLSGG